MRTFVSRVAALAIAAPFSLLRFLSPAIASQFDSCVLEHMVAAPSDLAAVSIKEACIRTVEAPLPSTATAQLSQATASFGELPSFVNGGGHALYVSLNNNTGYTITELIVSVQKIQTFQAERYVVRDFVPPPRPGVIVMGRPLDPSVLEMIRPGRASFYFAIGETLSPGAKFGDVYQWDIVSAKGFAD